MSSSNSFEIEIRTAHNVVYRRKLDTFELPLVESDGLSLQAETEFRVVVRTDAAKLPVRILLGSEQIGTLSAGSPLWQSDLRAWYRNEFGHSALRLERLVADGQSRSELLFTLPVTVSGRASVLRDYRVMLEDLQAIHENLAHDIVGRSFHDYGQSTNTVFRLQPELLLQSIRDIHRRLDVALAAIAVQPSQDLSRRTVSINYRGGERIDSASLQSIVRDPATRIDSHGRIMSIGKIRVRRPSVTQDLPEHRQIAQTIRDLANRVVLLRKWCRTSIDALEVEQQRWGKTPPGDRASGYEQRELPRIERLKTILQDSSVLADGLMDLIDRHAFLAEAGPPRSPFGPTPTFLYRPAYRSIFETLRDARSPLGVLVDGNTLRITYRDLATLYEYWCFIKVVECLRNRLGPPKSRNAFSLIDDVYRPVLSPGQQFQFACDANSQVIVRYTPEYLPVRIARSRGQSFGATLTGEPLRPDVTVELQRPGMRPVILVLDAKSSENIAPRRFREMSDYSRQIIDWRTGYQPVRQVFLMHRGSGQRPLVNIPGYLNGRATDEHSMILGAIACSPEHVGYSPLLLATVIDRFLAACGVGEPA